MVTLLDHYMTCWKHEKPSSSPLFIALQGPQGCGKTTLVNYMSHISSFHIVHLCLDDFYLPFQDQLLIYEHENYHPFYKGRGHAGTHDLPLLLDCLEKLNSIISGTLQIPVYDKLSQQGRGDRLPIDQWRSIHLPVDIVILEGWMMGFQPKIRLDQLPPILHTFNRYLYTYLPIYDYFDAFIQFQIDDITWIHTWRKEQEDHSKIISMSHIEDPSSSSSSIGMTDEDFNEFMDRFLAVYPFYTSDIIPNYPWKQFLIIHLTQDRGLKSFSTSS